MLKILVNLFRTASIFLPWKIRRRLLEQCFGYHIHPTARIGLAWVFPSHLEMGMKTRINHFTVAVNLNDVVLKSYATIGRGNWITGFAKGKSKHFTQNPRREPRLILGEHSSITKYHHIDCTDEVRIGKFTIVAGYRSQFLTHSVNIEENQQQAKAIVIGDYCFIGTSCVVLGGSRLPDYCVLGACSLLNRTHEEMFSLYAGIPAQKQKSLLRTSKYFCRKVGFVD